MPSKEHRTQTPDSERQALEGFLDSQREAIIRKIEGLDDATARKAPTASALSLLGIVKHCGLWERRWLQVVVAGQRFPGEWPEGNYTGMAEDFVVGEDDTVEQWVEARRPLGACRYRLPGGRLTELLHLRGWTSSQLAELPE